MENDNKSTPSEEEILVGKIQVLAGKTKADPHPDELEKLKKLIKKNVPFTLRSYFMAYLVREMIGANTPKGRTLAPKRETRAPQPKKAPKPQAPAARAKESTPVQAKETEERVLPEGARTLYLNIGKMKRLYAKELSLLLQTELEITREDIFSIRIHDKYSFISMSEENCEKAIAKLNGMDIKGRTAAVSYSNKE
ncbi:DbpA RNA binding domain-containing protein [uncultured Sphaerochaeta sp.]|uniref:DbpA RNA binding domain-containing protein n=1 Tax=uncultured Sphaerochaeta sp. TaxID=886478 RepID=UPI002A0A27A9|nr:DbpA RNA binding domain-containing protein [uncultured Sphaerochaeta sp.]